MRPAVHLVAPSLLLLAFGCGPAVSHDTGVAETDVADTGERDDTAGPDDSDTTETGDTGPVPDTEVDTSDFSYPPAHGACDALLAPYPLDGADAVVTAVARIAQPWGVHRTAQGTVDDFADNSPCPQLYAWGAWYWYAYAEPACQTRAGIRYSGMLDVSGDSYQPIRATYQDFHAIGPTFRWESDGSDVWDWHSDNRETIDAWWRWEPDGDDWLPAGEYYENLTWLEDESGGTRDIAGYLYVYDDGAGGPMGDLCASITLTGLDACPEEGDGTIELQGDRLATVTFDGAADCDACGRLALDGADAGEICF